MATASPSIAPRKLKQVGLLVNLRDPHSEQRMRFGTSSSFAFHPHRRPRVCGSVMHSWPHAEHFKTNVY
jgi:hypothetical protein